MHADTQRNPASATMASQGRVGGANNPPSA